MPIRLTDTTGENLVRDLRRLETDHTPITPSECVRVRSTIISVYTTDTHWGMAARLDLIEPGVYFGELDLGKTFLGAQFITRRDDIAMAWWPRGSTARIYLQNTNTTLNMTDGRLETTDDIIYRDGIAVLRHVTGSYYRLQRDEFGPVVHGGIQYTTTGGRITRSCVLQREGEWTFYFHLPKRKILRTRKKLVAGSWLGEVRNPFKNCTYIVSSADVAYENGNEQYILKENQNGEVDLVPIGRQLDLNGVLDRGDFQLSEGALYVRPPGGHSSHVITGGTPWRGWTDVNELPQEVINNWEHIVRINNDEWAVMAPQRKFIIQFKDMYEEAPKQVTINGPSPLTGAFQSIFQSCRWEFDTHTAEEAMKQWLVDIAGPMGEAEADEAMQPGNRIFLWFYQRKYYLSINEFKMKRIRMDTNIRNDFETVPAGFVAHRCSICGDEVGMSGDAPPRINGVPNTNGSRICQCCLNAAHQEACENCGSIDLADTMSDIDSQRYCSRCAESYDECSSCGGMFHVDTLTEGECRVCRRSGSRIMDYGFKPRFNLHRIGTEELCFGAEIELENTECSNNEEAEEAGIEVIGYPACKNFMFAKHDGSLNHGVEFVTHPFSWEWFVQNKQRFKDIFGAMRNSNFEARRTCGLHIHATRNPHSNLEEFRLYQLVYDNPTRWKVASARTCDMHSCQLESEYTTMRHRVQVSRRRGRFGNRYIALNPTSFNTIEWRLWAGTGQYSRFATRLAITAAAHAFVRSGATGLHPKWDKFVKFVQDHDQFGAVLADYRPDGFTISPTAA